MKKELIAYNDPKSTASEMFRTLRTNIQFMNTTRKLKTILVTSTMPGEGKSWVSSNLAVTFAQAGKKVVIVDADLRKGRQFAIFDALPKPGLSNYLAGMNIENSEDLPKLIKIQPTMIDNLFLIAAGDVPPNPAELLVSEKMEELIQKLEKIADIIIFDAPPGLVVTDAAILSRYVDSTVVVTAANQTKMDALEKTKRAIENVGGKISGVVINKIPSNNKKYEYYHSYYASSTTEMKKSNGKSKSVMSAREAAKPKNKVRQIIKNDQEDIYAFRERESDIKEITKKIEFTDMNKVDRAKDVLSQINQINSYLEEEKKKLKGDV